MNTQLQQDGTMMALKENNNLLEKQTIAIEMAAGIGFLFFCMCVWLIWYVIHNSVVNNIVAGCV